MARSYSLPAGLEWNPLKAHRNLACPCKSGRKAKACHGKSEILPEKMAAYCKLHLSKLKLETYTNAELASFVTIIKLADEKALLDKAEKMKVGKENAEKSDSAPSSPGV